MTKYNNNNNEKLHNASKYIKNMSFINLSNKSLTRNSQVAILRKLVIVTFAMLFSTGLIAADLGEEVTFGNWYLRGDIRANILIDSVHNDAGFSVARTEVFGDDGSENDEENSDNSRIPRSLDLTNNGVVESSRAIGNDVPELGFSLLGSRLAVGTGGGEEDNYQVLFELGITDPANPYALQLHRLWLEYGLVGIGLGWSTFMDFKKDERDSATAGYSYFPDTVDYIGVPGFAYQRQLALRIQLSPQWYLGLEEPQNLVYLGHEHSNTNNDDIASAPENLRVSTSSNGNNVYEISRRLRTRHLLPDLIFTYYGSGKKNNVFASFLLQHVKLDNNSPLLLESDSGYKSLISDAEGTRDLDILGELDRQLGINDDLSGGMENYNLAMNLGINGPMGRNSNNHYNLAYIYNGGRYLRDNPNPSHLVVKKDFLCLVDCNYKLVNVVSHAYLMDFSFGKRTGLIFSGIVTDDAYGIDLGGAATKQVHTTYFNYRQPFAQVAGLTSNYEVGYSYRQTFNTRHNSKYPRIRFSYGIGYKF